MTEDKIELSPKIPACEPAEELWTLLLEAPRPVHLAEYLPTWLDDNLTAAGLAKPIELRLRVFGNVLLDLTGQGWLFEATGELANPETVVMRATPPPETIQRSTKGEARPAPAEVKNALRRALVVSRDEQLRDPTVRAFVRRMEQPRLYRGQRVSVRSLLASPGQLAADLRVALAAPEAKRDEQLAELVQPYLQLASELPDEHTGLRLLDIWRYCRYTWSLPLQTQPGRRMFYLVRDAARPHHPIMGIAALGSAVVQISVRDTAIGWSLESLADVVLPDDASDVEKQKEQLKRSKRPSRIAALPRELDRAMTEIYRADLAEEGILSEEDCTYPTPEVLARLAAATDQEFLGSRKQKLQADELPAEIEPPKPQAEHLEAEARSPMFRKKRVQVLGELLAA